MWRWQSIQEFQYPLIEYLSAVKNLPLFIGVESVVAGHEHTSMSVITGQMPVSLDTATLPSSPGYTALGSATALAQWEYCFDRGDTDTSRGNVTGSANGNNWNCSVTGSLNAPTRAGTRPRRSWSRPAAPAPASRATTEDGRSDQVDGREPRQRQLLRARPPRARRPVQPGRQQRLQHRAPAQLQQRRAPKSAFGMETPAGPRRLRQPRRVPAVKRNNIGGHWSTRSAAPPTAAPASTARRSAACGTRCSARAATSGSSPAPTGTTAAASAPTTAARRRTSIPGEYQRDYVMVRERHGDKLRTARQGSSSTACAPATASPPAAS